MRTPGHDFDLVHGFLTTEGVIGGADDVLGLRYCDSVDPDGRNTYNVVDVRLAPGCGARLDLSMRRYAATPTLKFPWS